MYTMTLRFFNWIHISFLHNSWHLYACLTAVSKALCCQEQLIVSLRSCSCVVVANLKSVCLYCLHYLLPLASLCWYCISSAFVILSYLVFWNHLMILCNPLKIRTLWIILCVHEPAQSKPSWRCFWTDTPQKGAWGLFGCWFGFFQQTKHFPLNGFRVGSPNVFTALSEWNTAQDISLMGVIMGDTGLVVM